MNIPSIQDDPNHKHRLDEGESEMRGDFYQQFKPERAEAGTIWLLIGPRNSGKSFLMHDLLGKVSRNGKFHYGLGMTSTVSTAEMLKAMFPPRAVFAEGFEPSLLKNFVETAQMATSEHGGRGPPPQRGLLVTDDLMFDKDLAKDKQFIYIHMNGRHNNITLFNTAQYSKLVPPGLRTQVDYVVALGCDASEQKKLYESYFGVFPSFRDFQRVFVKLTANFGAIVLDRRTRSQDREKCIFWYKASKVMDPKYGGHNLIFKNDFYRRHQKYERELLRESRERAQKLREQKEEIRRKKIKHIPMDD